MFTTPQLMLSYGAQHVLVSLVVIYLLNEANAGSYLQTAASQTDTLDNSLSFKACLDGYKQLTPAQHSRYVDASGKPGSGMFGGNFRWFGSFSECHKQAEARYCLSTFKALIELIPGKFQVETLQWGICIPKSCSNKDVVEKIDFLLHNVSKITAVKRIERSVDIKLNCDESIDYDAGTIITIILCGSIVALCIVATATELVTERKIVSDDNVAHKNSNDFIIENRENEHTPLMSTKNETPTKKSSTYDILNCFSLVRNVQTILNANVGSRDLTYLHGIRVLSMFWVILGHCASILFRPQAIGNPHDVKNMGRRFLSMVLHRTFSVDTFFVLSGFLVAYTNLRKLDKRPGKTFWLKFYFHRYWRLTPPLLFAVLLVAKLVPHFGQGPLWNEGSIVNGCSSYWWTNMLYINNIHPKSGLEKCISQTWFLAADMQLFIVSPILILVACRFGQRALVALSTILILASMMAVGIVVGTQDYVPWTDITRFTKEIQDMGFGQYVYLLPYSHAQCYIIGAVFGYFIHKFSLTRFKLSRVKVAFFWMVALASIVACVYLPYDSMKNDPDEMSRGGRVIYAVLRYTCWSLAIVWIMFACHFGYAGLISNILAAKFWIPLSRINYLTYIIHLKIIEVLYLNIEFPIHYTTFTLVIYYLAVLVLSYGCAFVLTVAVELPCSNLEPFTTRSRKS